MSYYKTQLLNRVLNDDESGFTLIELLIVMIIIGVLSAIAVPAFLNQQKGARDTATVSDARTVAMAMHSALIYHPTGRIVAILPGDQSALTTMPASHNISIETGDVTTVTILMGEGKAEGEFTSSVITLTEGTRVKLAVSSIDSIRVRTWNVKGKKHNSYETSVIYDSEFGGVNTGQYDDWYVPPEPTPTPTP